MDKSINLNPVGMSPLEAQLTQLYQLILLKVLLYCSHYIVHVCQKLTRFYNLLYISSFFYYWKFSSHFFPLLEFLTAQKMKSSIMNFFRKRDQIRRKLRIWSRFLKKFIMENFIFCPVSSLFGIPSFADLFGTASRFTLSSNSFRFTHFQ